MKATQGWRKESVYTQSEFLNSVLGAAVPVQRIRKLTISSREREIANMFQRLQNNESGELERCAIVFNPPRFPKNIAAYTHFAFT